MNLKKSSLDAEIIEVISDVNNKSGEAKKRKLHPKSSEEEKKGEIILKPLKHKLKSRENSEIDELDLFEITSAGSLVEDMKKFEMKISKVPDIEVREIIISKTGNFLNLQDNVINIPMEMLIFPFFTPQKQNKRINFQYRFEDMGVTMMSTLIAKNVSDKVFQPSIFEEKIYTYLISMYEAQKEADDDSEYIDFEISDFIENFLGNKMNRTYYTKVEQSLKNLKNTEYQFIVSNHTKLGKFKFEDEEFKLLTYQKLKTGKKVYYRVILNKNIRRKIKEKRYVKYNSKPLVEIMNIDPIASRIYKYISFARMGEDTNRINIRTLAAIIPLKTEQITERVGKDGRTKEYILCRMKQVLARILKAFEVLTKLGYIEYCQEERVKQENTYYLTYKFNKEKDWTCHISSYIENNSPRGKKKMLINSKKEKEKEKATEQKDIKTIVKANSLATDKIKVSKNDFSDIIYKKIDKAKKNIYINKSWEKKVEGKIHRIYKEHGEEFTILVLENLSKLAGPVKTTLIQYLNGMLSNMLSDKNKKDNLQIFVLDDNKKALNGKINITKTGLKRAEKNFIKVQSVEMPQEKTFSEKYEKLDELEKLKIEQQALKRCCKETDISEKMLLKMKDQLPVAYKNALKDYIDKILEEKK